MRGAVKSGIKIVKVVANIVEKEGTTLKTIIATLKTSAKISKVTTTKLVKSSLKCKWTWGLTAGVFLVEVGYLAY